MTDRPAPILTMADLAARHAPATAAARVVKGAASAHDDPPKPTQEHGMPKGIYERKKKDPAAKADKPKRKYARKARANGHDVGDTLEELLMAGAHVVEVVKESVDVEDAPELGRALKLYEIAQRLHGIKG